MKNGEWRKQKNQRLLKTHGKINTSPKPAGSAARPPKSRQSPGAPRAAPLSPRPESRARARRITPPLLSWPMKNVSVLPHLPVANHVTVPPRPLTRCLQVLRRWRRFQSFTMSLGKVTWAGRARKDQKPWEAVRKYLLPSESWTLGSLLGPGALIGPAELR